MEIPTININTLPPKEIIPLYLNVEGIMKCYFPHEYKDNFDYIKYNILQSEDDTFIFNDYKWEIVNLSHILNDIINKRLISANYYFIFCYILTHFATIINNAEILHVVHQISENKENVLNSTHQELILALNNLIKIYVGTYMQSNHLRQQQQQQQQQPKIVEEEEDYEDYEDDDEDNIIIPTIEKGIFPPDLSSEMKKVKMQYTMDIYDNYENDHIDPTIKIYTDITEFSTRVMDISPDIIGLNFVPMSIMPTSTSTIILGTFKSPRIDISEDIFVFNYLDLQTLLSKHIDKEAKVEPTVDNLLKLTIYKPQTFYIRLEYNSYKWLPN
jgi:hypothetical protein